MAKFELVMPKLGESIIEATILKWLKNEGDYVKKEETLLEIATDKVDSEVPSEVAGILVKQLFKEGEVVPIGTTIAILETEAATQQQQPAPPIAAAQTIENQIKTIEQQTLPTPNTTPANTGVNNGFYSPLVLKIAQEENISTADLQTIQGTGQNNRLTKNDILEYVAYKKLNPTNATPALKETATTPPPKSTAPTPAPQAIPANAEIIEMDRMRRLIADHMVHSKHTAPHVTSFVECDVTNLVNWRNKIKDKFLKQEGEGITFTPIFVQAVAKAIKDFPRINSSVEGYNIIQKKDINIGIAAALPSGNLIVPVIKNADRQNLIGLTKSTNELVQKARQNQLKPDDIQGGTFTLSNVGTFGNTAGTPIINQPQVAILATGAIKKKPAVIETEYGDVIAIRHLMFLSLSYDHRIIDGALGGSFLRRVADYLENFDHQQGI